jgi:polyhydroxyalkanoate synthesis regulator protein
LLVDNGKAMQKILRATQVEAEQSRALADQSRLLTEEMKKILQATQAETQMARRMAVQSQQLTEEMKKDSAAMKTVIPVSPTAQQRC